MAGILLEDYDPELDELQAGLLNPQAYGATGAHIMPDQTPTAPIAAYADRQGAMQTPGAAPAGPLMQAGDQFNRVAGGLLGPHGTQGVLNAMEIMPGPADVRDFGEGMATMARGAVNLDPTQVLEGVGKTGQAGVGLIPGGDVLGPMVKGALGAAAPLALPAVRKQALADSVRQTAPDAQDVGVVSKVDDGSGNTIRVFHGSPHDFDEFSMDKIGTGEGAQAYGHGLYFAESEGVARSYRDALARSGLVDGKPYDWKDGRHVAAELLTKHGNRKDALAEADEALRDLHDRRDLYGDEFIRESGTPMIAARDLLASGAKLPEHKKGSMFEVDIKGKPEEFLDYDAPLKGQKAEKSFEKIWKAKGPDYNMDDLQNIDGSTALRLLEAGGEGAVAAAEALRKAGIKGIRYADAGSRGPGQATYKGSNWQALDFADDADYDAVGGVLKQMERAGASPGHAILARENEVQKHLGNTKLLPAIREELTAELQKLKKLQASDFGMEEPSRNYVVFDDDMLEIIRKYGLVLPGAAAGVAATGGLLGPDREAQTSGLLGAGA